MIKTKTKGREGRDDVSFDLDDEEEEKDDEECKRRGESGIGEREKKTRSIRETIIYEARGV